MNPKVSVIVPVYGAEAFLPTCISSLRAQTLRDIELIFVCDGSPDHSLAILRRVESLDSRIRVIAFEENQGVSAARNAGLDAARGDYIGFCDGDDWAEPQMYETLLRAAEEAEADVAFCRVFKDRGEAREDVPLGFDDGTVFSREEIGRTLIPAMLSRPTDSDELPLSGYTPRNLFRREAIGSHRFRPDIRYAEDLLFIVACMKDARCAVAVDRAYYHYRFHSGSVTKHFSFHVPESYEKSNDALEALLADSPECMRRMKIRRRKMAVGTVRNFCYPGTPYAFWERVRRAKAYMNRPDIAALFDDVTVTEYAPDGTSVVVWHNDFSDGSQKPENAWSSDGTGSWSMSEGYLKISGGTDDYVLTFDKLKLREGCKYKISGHMQTVGAPSGGFADIRADFSLAENVYESGREYVFAELSEIVRFGKENNVPIYFGEFGADAESFKNGLGGERWVADVMDFFNENGISYSYHAYHEPMFGFYPEDTVKYPQHRNEALAKVFADKNRNG